MIQKDKKETVFVVDDDETFLNSVVWLLKTVPFQVEAFTSVAQLLEAVTPEAHGCIVADLRMPGSSGLDLQRALAKRRIRLPFIIMTAYGDVESAVRALKAGAFDFVQKPFNDQLFIDLVNNAIKLCAEQKDEDQAASQARARLRTLTPRETEVLDLVVNGMTNKTIAARLGISDKTVETHRARITEKTGAKSLAELVRTTLIAPAFSAVSSGGFHIRSAVAGSGDAGGTRMHRGGSQNARFKRARPPTGTGETPHQVALHYHDSLRRCGIRGTCTKGWGIRFCPKALQRSAFHRSRQQRDQALRRAERRGPGGKPGEGQTAYTDTA